MVSITKELSRFCEFVFPHNPLAVSVRESAKPYRISLQEPSSLSNHLYTIVR